MTEIPIREIRAVVEMTRSFRLGEHIKAIQDELLAVYDVGKARMSDIEHINKAIPRSSR